MYSLFRLHLFHLRTTEHIDVGSAAVDIDSSLG